MSPSVCCCTQELPAHASADCARSANTLITMLALLNALAAPATIRRGQPGARSGAIQPVCQQRSGRRRCAGVPDQARTNGL